MIFWICLEQATKDKAANRPPFLFALSVLFQFALAMACCLSCLEAGQPWDLRVVADRTNQSVGFRSLTHGQGVIAYA